MKMEKQIKIKTPDKKIIDGILYGPINKPLILIVHGLAGNMHEAMHYNAARYFARHGFSSFRFGLYSFQKNNRKLHECTLQTHGQDISTVIKYLRSKGARKILAVGHSYGFPSILHSKDCDFGAIVSWDGTMLPHKYFKNLPKNLRPKGRFLDEGYLTLMSEDMVRESKKVDSLKLIKSFGNMPIKFITANSNKIPGQKMYKSALGPKEYININGATHCFVEDGKQEQLYKETVDWLRKF